jgi:hypothetical protein
VSGTCGFEDFGGVVVVVVAIFVVAVDAVTASSFERLRRNDGGGSTMRLTRGGCGSWKSRTRPAARGAVGSMDGTITFLAATASLPVNAAL